MKNKKILILGGGGFVGSHLALALVKHNADVIVMCRNPEKIKDMSAFRGVHLVSGDITRYEDVVKHMPGKDIIINLTTVVFNTGIFEPYTDLEINCKGQINVLEARKNTNTKAQYIYIGSSMQFGRVNEKDLPITENYCQTPISLYATHKVAAENYCNIYRKAYGLPSIVVRFPPLYGPSLTNTETRSIIEKFIKKIIRNEVFNVNGFGEDLKDFFYIDDVVDLLICIMKSPIQEGVYNAGSGKGVKFADVAKMIVEEYGSGQYNLVPFPKELEPFEVGSFYSDISKIKKDFGWNPKIDIREGIKRMVAFYKKQSI